MCLSTEVSLATGTALVTIGGHCARTAWRRNRAYVPLAVVPVLFGVQQLFEAGVWVGLDRASPVLVKTAALGFLFFAAALWPCWLPIAAAAIEEQRAKRKLFYAFAWVGVGFALTVYLPVVARANDGFRVVPVRHSLRYDVSGVPTGVGALGALGQALYLAAVSVPPLLSQDRRVRVLGAGLVASAAVSELVYWYAFTSVWCFFAALLSLYLAFVVHRVPEPSDTRCSANALAAP
ncbi:hypothetical protein GobsT_69700 [Gemmata obscuriglobus]|uniref:Uncharacterized protein n=1 Tax=Gemmata obscuriglobus TaxID=114 RepID=A0A2Z3HDT6_9BACT|nr:DUF6629 family protein [Gemmata obscuriglobus]AWM41906.1 hypothetical protein C1280_36210 [Gemmata obscuriglobus]QEG32119.1 hypothetical protein GobsT_69700 [Gemmata obscuriglobus]VTS11472.1 Uncharacterized protein OS=Methyloglobulus morosus KoM1 GN=MGMO_54c00040 PE=4 SV=1 [Gemmata obscuriglobus UQM 2246]